MNINMTYRWMAERSKLGVFYWLSDWESLYGSIQRTYFFLDRNGGMVGHKNHEALKLSGYWNEINKKNDDSLVSSSSPSVFEVLTLHLGPSQQRPQTRAPCPGEHRPCSNLALSLPWSSRSSMECIDRIRDGISLYWNHFIVLFNGFTSI